MASSGGSGDSDGVRNDLDGTIAGSSVQAGVVHGDVHFHHAPTEQAAEPARVVPRQLPGTVHIFTNRDAEQNALTALLDAADGANTVVISAIDGTAGIGKTTLALYWGHQVRDRFPDGQLYVNLRGFDPAAEPMPAGEALRGFLDALGVASEKIPADTDARAALYRSVIHGQRLLIVLDNALSTEQIRPLLPGNPTCLVLVTSRNQLDGLVVRDGARRMTLDFLTTPEARALLISYLGQDRVDAEPDAVNELIQRCVHLPLALSVVAARAAGNPTFPLSALVDELHDEQDRLDALDIGDDTGVRAVFSWSYRALSADAARMFRLLGLPTGPDIGLRAAAALAGLPDRQARRLLDGLARVHLLEHYVPGRYRFHDLLHTYAAERANHDEPGRDAALRRLLDWYLHTAHNADRQLRPQHYAELPLPDTDITPVTFSADAEALAWYDTERTNLFAAIPPAAASGLHTHAWQLPRTMRHFCRLRGHVQEWNNALHTGLAAARHIGDRRAEADIVYEIALAYYDVKQYQNALPHNKEALALYEEVGDHNGVLKSLTALGFVSTSLRLHREAISYLNQALRQDAAGRYKNETLHALGDVHDGLGLHHEAIRHYQDALVLNRQSAEHRGQGANLHKLGDVYLTLGKFGEAVAHYRQALTVRRKIGDRPGEGVTLWKLGVALRQTGDLAGARECLQQALPILDNLGRPEADEVRAALSELDEADS